MSYRRDLACRVAVSVALVAGPCAALRFLHLGDSSAAIQVDAGRDASAVSIFLSNARILGLLVSGVLAGGLPTVVVLVGLGAQLGHLAAQVGPGGVPFAVAAASLLPHGVAEMSSFVAAGAAGLGGPTLLWAFANGYRERTRHVGRETCALALGAALALASAAWIEATVTPWAIAQVVQW